MPTVPRYNSAQVNQSGLPNVQDSGNRARLIPELNNTQALSDIGRGLSNAGVQLEAYEKERDEATVLQADAATREAYIGFQQESRKRKGLSAEGLTEEANKWWTDTAQKTIETLGNERQKQLYINRLRGVRLSSLESIGQYQEQQVRLAKQEGAISSMDSAAKMAQDDPTNPLLLNEALETIKRTSMALGAENGDAPEKTKMDMLTRTSALHQGILQQISDADPKKAREYLNLYGAEMTPAARGQTERILQVSEKSLAVNNKVAEVMLSGADEATALKSVRESFANDPESMKIAVSEVKTQFREQEDMLDKASKAAFDRAWTIAIDNGRGYKGIDSQTLTMLTPQQRDSINDEIYQRQERLRVQEDRAIARRNRIEDKADKLKEDAKWETYYNLRQEAASNPEAFKKRDLRLVYKDIPKERREELIDLQTKDSSSIKEITSLDKQIALTIGSEGLKDESKFKFETAVRDAITTEQKRTKKISDQDARQKVIDGMIIKGEVPGFWNDKEGMAYEFYGTPEASKFIPNDDVITERFINTKGREPTSTELAAIKAQLLKGN